MNKQKLQSILKISLLLLIAVLFFIFQQPNNLFKNGAGIFAWFVYIPVLLLIKNCSLKISWLSGALYGALSYGILGYWVIYYGFWGLIVVTVGYSIILGFIFLFLKLADIFFNKTKVLMFFLILTSYEYLKTLGFAGLNYGVCAYSQWKNILLIQICDKIGVFGLNSILILSSCLIYEFICEFKKLKENKNALLKIGISAGIYLCILISVFLYGNSALKRNYSNNKIKVAAIQHNENPNENGIEIYKKNTENLIKISKNAVQENPDLKLIVWPETAVVPSIMYQYYDRKEPKRLEIINSILNFVEDSECAFVIGNGTTVKEDNEIRNYNSALFFKNKDTVKPPVPEIYYKTKLVPFSEYFPYKKILPNLYKYIHEHEKNMWDQGSEYKIFNMGELYFSTPICFEDTFTYTCRKMYLKGARCFINLSNDSWSHNIACQNQHLSMAIFRCIENRVSEVRSCTSGQTCIISPAGIITAKAPAFTKSYAVGEIDVIEKNRKPTLYTKYGDIIPLVNIIMLFVMLIMKIILVIINKYKLN